MGTGPWPQPPTEAEQLQALMATANGESCAVSFSFLPHRVLRMTVFLSGASAWAGVAGRWRGFTLRFLLEGISPGSLTGRLCPHRCFHVHSVLGKLLGHTVSTSTHRKTAQLICCTGKHDTCACLHCTL